MKKFPEKRLETVARSNERSRLEKPPPSQKQNPFQRKITAVVLATTLIFIFSNCDKIRNLRTTDLIETIAPLRQDTCYIVGVHGCYGFSIQDSTARVNTCVFISEDLNDTLFASMKLSPLIDSVNSFFTFPAKIMPWYVLGPTFFPENYRFAYKVLITYKPMTEEEVMNTSFFCTGYHFLPDYIFDPAFIVILSITKI